MPLSRATLLPYRQLLQELALRLRNYLHVGCTVCCSAYNAMIGNSISCAGCTSYWGRFGFVFGQYKDERDAAVGFMAAITDVPIALATLASLRAAFGATPPTHASTRLLPIHAGKRCRLRAMPDTTGISATTSQGQGNGFQFDGKLFASRSPLQHRRPKKWQVPRSQAFSAARAQQRRT